QRSQVRILPGAPPRFARWLAAAGFRHAASRSRSTRAWANPAGPTTESLNTRKNLDRPHDRATVLARHSPSPAVVLSVATTVAGVRTPRSRGTNRGTAPSRGRLGASA